MCVAGTVSGSVQLCHCLCEGGSLFMCVCFCHMRLGEWFICCGGSLCGGSVLIFDLDQKRLSKGAYFHLTNLNLFFEDHF